MKKIKRPLSIILSVLMVVSMLVVAPVAASAAEETSTVTWDNNSLQKTSGGKTSGGVTLTTEQGNTRVNDCFYSDRGSATFTAPEGAVFTKIELKNAEYVNYLNFPGATVAESGGYWDTMMPDEPEWIPYYTVTWTGESSEVTFSGAVYGIQSIVFTLKSTAAELPEAIKDCTYKQTDSEFYANVPFMPDDAIDYSSLLDGTIYAGGDSRTIVLGDAKGYSYKFYDQTGTEIAANLAGNSDTPGSEAGLGDGVTLYKKYFILSIPVEKLYIVATAPEPTSEPALGEATFYVVGSFTEPAWQASDDYKMTLNEAADVTEYMLTGVEFTEGTTLKVMSENASVQGGDQHWYPDGTDNDYEVQVTGTYNIYCRPNYDGGEGWYYNCIYLALQEEETTTEPTTEPTTAPVEETITLNSSTDKLSDYGIQNLHYGAHSDFNGSELPWGTFVAPTGKVFTKIVTNGVDHVAMNWTGSAERVDHDGMMGEWYIDWETDEDGFRPFTISFTLTDAPAASEPTTEPTTTEPPAEPDPATVVTAMIEALPDPANITLEDEAKVNAAMAAYMVLTDEQKTAIGSTATTKLYADAAKINDLAAVKAVTDQINALPAELTLNDDLDVTAARQAYDNLTAAQKEIFDQDVLTKLTGAEAKIADLTAAKDVEDAINALPAEITLDNAADVQAARQAYNALTDAQKALVDADTLQKLSDAETKIEDLTAAKTITDQINALPAVDNLTLNDELDVVAARQAYDLLTDAQKALVDADALTKLSNAETRIADLTAAQPVIDAINALPPTDSIALTDAEAVEDARADYNALTDAQKALIVADTLQKLSDAETKIEDLTAAKAVTDAINALPATITLDDVQTVAAARAAYNALTNDQKALVDTAAYTKLTDAETAIANMQAAGAVTDLIDAIPETVTTQDEQQVAAARAAYNALNEAQQALVDSEAVARLEAAEKSINDQKAANAVTDQINALPTVITLEDKADVEAARAAYNGLTDDQKNLVTDETLNTLIAAETVITNREAAKAVEDMINALPDDITLDDKAAVNAANEARLNLPPEQAEYLTLAAIDKLFKAMDKIEDLEAAKAVTDQINALPAEITLNDKAAVEAARQAYTDLTDDQKNLVTDETLDKLADAEKVIADREAAKVVEDMIDALPDKVTSENKQSFKDAMSAFIGLTYAQADYIPQETQDKVTNAFWAVFIVEGVENIRDDVTLDNVTLEDKAIVGNMSALYDGVSDEVKAFVNDATVEKLNAAKKTIPDLYAAKTVIDLIDALPSDVTVDDKDQITGARAAYDALTDDQKALVADETVNKLAAAERALEYAEDLKAAGEASDMIKALPGVLGLRADDKDAVEAAQAAYDALSDQAKSFVSLADKFKLAAVVAAMPAVIKAAEDQAAAAEVTELISALPSAVNVTVNDKEAIENAANAYDALTDDQKGLVSLANRLKLTAVKGALDAAEKIYEDETAAKAVEAMIEALPAAADVTVEDEEAINTAKAAYDALTDDQKRIVTLVNRTKLELDVAALAAAKDEAAADEVEALIEALPDSADVTVDDADAINAAQEAYNALTDAQKRLVPLTLRTKLAADAAALVDAQNDEPANAVEEMIEALPAAADVTLEDKEAIEAARAAYDALTPEQKRHVTLVNRTKLVLDEAAVAKIENDIAAAAAVKEQIEALPNAEDLTLADRNTVLAARAAYNRLTDDQKALIDFATVSKLNEDENVLLGLAEVEVVKGLINAVPAADQVTAGDKDYIELVRAAYNALPENLQQLIDEETMAKLTDAEDALAAVEADMAAAADVEALIDALPNSLAVTLEDKEAIEAANEAYNALTDAQKEYVPARDRIKLEADTAVLEALEKAAEDSAAADAVEELIEALPAVTAVTVDDKDAIAAADEAYNALTDDQKDYVSLANKIKLAAAKGALAAAEKAAVDEAAADAVEELIDALPASGDITLDDKPAVEEARAAYNALTPDQKRLVTLVNRAKLAYDEAAIEKIENDNAAADAVAELINALPAPEDVTYEDRGDIFAAGGAYENLTDDQKALIAPETLQKLEDDEQALLDIIEVMIVDDAINALPAAEDVTLNDAEDIAAVREAYDALDDAQKAQISEETLKKLTDAEEALANAQADKEAAEAVEEKIQALPAAIAVTVNDKDAIEAADEAYNALTDAQKDYVSTANKIKLAAAKGALAAAEKAAADEAAADAVEAMIDALPAPGSVTLADKEAIAAAREAYDALTPDQKRLVTLVDRAKLAFDEAALAKIENDIAAADAVTDMINALPAAEDVTFDDNDAILAARDAYDKLTDDQKALVTDDTLKKLTDAEEALAEVTEVMAVKEAIDNLPAAEDVTLRDTTAIEAARAAYEALDDAQKAQIDDDTLKKLTDAEEALAKVKADNEAAEAVEALIEALPNPLSVTIDDKEAIEQAQAAYDALTPEQHDLVSLADRVKLAADAAVLQKIEDDIAAAGAVTDMINALPAVEDLTYDDKADVEAAREAFDNLTFLQKVRVGAETYQKLAEAEDRMSKFALLGDANGDGKITVKDVTAIQRHIAEIDVLSGNALTSADVNQDGKITIDDATALQMYLAEMEVEYPIGEMV